MISPKPSPEGEGGPAGPDEGRLWETLPSSVVGAAYMRPARVRQMAACGRHICRSYPVALFLPRACNKVPGRDKSLPYTHLINENARRISTAGIVHAINY